MRPRSEQEAAAATVDSAALDIVTFRVAGQLFGVPLTQVHDVLKVKQCAAIPRARPEILGAFNLRGRIATVVALQRRLGLGGKAPCLPSLGVVVEQEDHLYGLLVDSMGDVLSLPPSDLRPLPATLSPVLHALSAGGASVGSDLLVVLEVGRLFMVEQEEAA